MRTCVCVCVFVTTLQGLAHSACDALLACAGGPTGEMVAGRQTHCLLVGLQNCGAACRQRAHLGWLATVGWTGAASGDSSRLTDFRSALQVIGLCQRPGQRWPLSAALGLTDSSLCPRAPVDLVAGAIGWPARPIRPIHLPGRLCEMEALTNPWLIAATARLHTSLPPPRAPVEDPPTAKRVAIHFQFQFQFQLHFYFHIHFHIFLAVDAKYACSTPVRCPSCGRLTRFLATLFSAVPPCLGLALDGREHDPPDGFEPQSIGQPRGRARGRASEWTKLGEFVASTLDPRQKPTFSTEPNRLSDCLLPPPHPTPPLSLCCRHTSSCSFAQTRQQHRPQLKSHLLLTGLELRPESRMW
ncbi:unnamed protein product [Protopolystoma xenopodis]|uniref:Secreted protein n=1 Tax=Protopolystoma xenopodis TaxID=117903 RepID=A0A3S5BAA1_9PLAT|nr:unnamed protein product [Protopolystoma xenopodis]